MTAKEKMKEYIKAVSEYKKAGEKNNLLNMQLMENFKTGERVLICCFDVPEFDELTFEAWHFRKNSFNSQYWLCENALEGEGEKLWDKLLQGWYNEGFKQTTFVNFERD